MKRFSTFKIMRILGVTAALIASTPALSKGGDSSRSFLVSLPILGMSTDTTGHFEMNLGGASLGLEAGYARPAERLTEKEITASGGDSFIPSGRQFSLLIARYTNAHNMSGFYWALGAGYRTLDVTWKKKPYDNPIDGLGLVDEAGKVTHKLSAAGATGHVRIGYRYVAESWPFSIGAFFGLRHFDGKVVDKEADPTQPNTYAKTSSQDKLIAKHRLMTRPDIGLLELGMAF